MCYVAGVKTGSVAVSSLLLWQVKIVSEADWNCLVKPASFFLLWFSLACFYSIRFRFCFVLLADCDPHLIIETAKMKARKLTGWFAAQD